MFILWNRRAVDKVVAQVSKPAVSRVSKPADALNWSGPIVLPRTADLEVGDTAGLETCATLDHPNLSVALGLAGSGHEHANAGLPLGLFLSKLWIMQAEMKQDFVSVDDYLSGEERGEVKHEYI